MKWNPLAPDSEGHYSALAHEADRASLKRFRTGQHPLDAIARQIYRVSSRGLAAAARPFAIGSCAM